MPLLRVLRGSADEDEIAALVTALAAVTAPDDAGSGGPGGGVPVRSEWRAATLPATRPRSWRAAGLPRR